MKISFKNSLLALALLSGSTLANAHATFENGSAQVGSTYKAVVRIGHGCGDQPTTAMRVSMPAGMIKAKPMPKAGWNVAVKTADYDKTYQYYGSDVKSGVTEITWSGNSLPADFYDEFVFTVFVSDAFKKGDEVYFKTVQTCAKGENPWVEIPKKGQDAHSLKFPAPMLKIKAAGKHHHH